jgi:hypothetical protein
VHDYSESNSFVHEPTFNLGGGIILKANQKSLLREALPFGVFYDKAGATKPLKKNLLTKTLTPSIFYGLMNEGFESPRYTAALDPQFSCLTLSCSPSCSTVVGDAENTLNAPNFTGFHLKSCCLVFIDRNGLAYPITFHLVMLLIALSVHIPKTIRAMAVSTFDEVSPMDMPLRLQTTYHPARICWLHDPNFFDEFGIDMSQYIGYYGTCTHGLDHESLSENASSYPSYWDVNTKEFTWSGPVPVTRAKTEPVEYTPQSGTSGILASAVPTFSQIVTTLADYYDLGEDTRHVFEVMWSVYPSGKLGALLTTTLIAFVYHCVIVFLNIFSFLSFGLGTAFGYIFLSRPIQHTSFFSPMAVVPSKSKRKSRAERFAPQSGEADNPDMQTSEEDEPGSPLKDLSATNKPSANSMRQIGGVSMPADASFWSKEHAPSCVSAFHTRSSALPNSNFGSSSRSCTTIAGESRGIKTSDKGQSSKSISSQSTVPASNTSKLKGFEI